MIINSGKARELKDNWEKAKKSIVNYFDKNGIAIVINEENDFAEARFKKDNSILCTCFLNDEDIVKIIIRLKPELKTAELSKLETELDQTYSEYVKEYLKRESIVDKNKADWEASKQSILDYFNKNGIAIEFENDNATAYDIKDKSVICSCSLEESDIITSILKVRPELKTKELVDLGKNLNKTYAKYVNSLIDANEENSSSTHDSPRRIKIIDAEENDDCKM